MAKRGRFITFEGGEGSGKSTQVRRLAERLEAHGIALEVTREPGGSPGAEEVRKLIIHGEASRWDALSEVLLISAARRDHLRSKIEPALEAGRWVLCDRFADSTKAYQGYGHGLAQETIDALYAMVAGDLRPDLTLILDVPLDVGLGRAAVRAEGGQRFETLDRGFHQRLRDGFLEIAKQEPLRCRVIDANQDIEAVAEAVRQQVDTALEVDLP